MKKVKIKNLSKVKRGYSVFIDSENTFIFSSEKKAKQFLIKLSKFLTQQAFELNKVYTELYSEYRRLYFTISVSLSSVIENQFNDVSNHIKRSLMISGQNSNYFSKNHLEQSYSLLESITYQLLGLVKKSSFTPLIYLLNSIQSHLDRLRNEFQKLEVYREKTNFQQFKLMAV